MINQISLNVCYLCQQKDTKYDAWFVIFDVAKLTDMYQNLLTKRDSKLPEKIEQSSMT